MIMEYYEKYVSYLQAEGTGSTVLQKLYLDAADSLASDPPEEALTRTGQMVAAMLRVAKSREPLERQMVDAVNSITDMIMDYLYRLGWHTSAYKTPEGWKYVFPPV